MGRRPSPEDLVPPLPGVPDLVWEPREVERIWTEELERDDLSFAGATELEPLPGRPALHLRGAASRNRGTRTRRGRERAPELRPFGASARSSPSRTAARRSARRTCCGGSTRACSSADDELPREPQLLFAIAPARRGFVWRELGLVLLPDAQVFRKRPPRAPAHLGRALQSFADLRTGDYIVHEDHGVGKLLGFETRTVADVTRDYLQLGFKGDDRLYVPHEQIGKVSRYIGADARAPALSKLGGRAWQLIKSRARASVHELAGELLALYARRQTAPGSRFDLSNDWLERLEAEFPYRETEDQQRAIEAVKADLEAPHPMDRLVCGDVGFGKTEVAIRAAFASAVNGKQTLMLVPTTVLAQQHWNTFRERFREFPIRVEMISRLRPPGAAEAGARRLRRGEGRRPRRHAPAPVARRHPEEPRPRHPRRGAALRRRPEGAAPLAAAGGRRARALGDADPAHAAHVAVRTARHLRDRDPARGSARDPDERGGVRRRAGQGGPRARARTRGPVLLPAQPGRDDRGSRAQAAAAVPRPSLRGRARTDAGAGARGQDALVPARRRRRPRLDHDHRVRPRHPAGEHADHRARRPARARPALPDPRTRRAARTSSPTPTSSIPTRAS